VVGFSFYQVAGKNSHRFSVVENGTVVPDIPYSKLSSKGRDDHRFPRFAAFIGGFHDKTARGV
jgi:hypothetical protein